MLHATQRRYKAGDASRTDIALAQSGTRALEAELRNAAARRQNSETNLRTLTQRAARAALARAEVERLLPASLAEAQRLAAVKNPQLAAAFHEADAAGHAANVSIANALPQVSLVGEYAYQHNSSGAVRREEDLRLGVEVSVPLVDLENLGSIRTGKARARASYHRALAARRDVAR